MKREVKFLRTVSRLPPSLVIWLAIQALNSYILDRHYEGGILSNVNNGLDEEGLCALEECFMEGW